MTNHKYLIRMTPLNTYFFGGEKTFTTPTGETNYFARSNRWPQQTTVLGLLRYLIGKEWEFDPLKIGNHSFIADCDDGFGIIEKISPVFILSKDENEKDIYLFEAGTDHQKHKKTGTLTRIALKKESAAAKTKYGVYNFLDPKNQNLPNLAFDYKEPLVSALYNPSSGTKLFDPDTIFHEQFQVGNKKNYDGGTDDDAFFKQVFYRLEKNSSFAVIMETNEILTFDSIIDTMGADQSVFRIEAKEIGEEENIFETIIKGNESNANATRLVLLSDAFVDPELLKKCTYSICDTVDFRNILTHSISQNGFVKTQNFDAMNARDSANKTKVKFNLLRRGSVLFTNNPEDMSEAFNNKSFQKIGYNYFQLKD